MQCSAVQCEVAARPFCTAKATFAASMLQKFLAVTAVVGLIFIRGGNSSYERLKELQLAAPSCAERNILSHTASSADYVTNILTLPTGHCQCYTAPVCGGDTIDVTEAGSPIANQTDCCVGTNAGLSYNNGSSCNLCIGMSVRCL